jgi:hypothetical protein
MNNKRLRVNRGHLLRDRNVPGGEQMHGRGRGNHERQHQSAHRRGKSFKQSQLYKPFRIL